MIQLRRADRLPSGAEAMVNTVNWGGANYRGGYSSGPGRITWVCPAFSCLWGQFGGTMRAGEAIGSRIPCIGASS